VSAAGVADARVVAAANTLRSINPDIQVRRCTDTSRVCRQLSFRGLAWCLCRCTNSNQPLETPGVPHCSLLPADPCCSSHCAACRVSSLTPVLTHVLCRMLLASAACSCLCSWARPAAWAC
jgi:hypothetical protein